eukprot:3295977-Ditylum_brightwellii.AAC.1
MCATTGNAAALIGGSTLHSCKEGFALPIRRTSYSPLLDKSLADQHKKCKNIKLFILDEFSIMMQKEIHYLDERLKQIMHSFTLFGGVIVLFVGDPAQLSLVQGQTL